MKIDNRILDSGVIGCKEKIPDGINAFPECTCSLVWTVGIEENDAFATTFRDIRVLIFLGLCEVAIVETNYGWT